MDCISLATFSILKNGDQCGHISPTREFCQGDPLSPYLLLLCTEGLSSPISNAAQNNSISGIVMAHNHLKVTTYFAQMIVSFS